MWHHVFTLTYLLEPVKVKHSDFMVSLPLIDLQAGGSTSTHVLHFSTNHNTCTLFKHFHCMQLDTSTQGKYCTFLLHDFVWIPAASGMLTDQLARKSLILRYSPAGNWATKQTSTLTCVCVCVCVCVPAAGINANSFLIIFFRISYYFKIGLLFWQCFMYFDKKNK